MIINEIGMSFKNSLKSFRVALFHFSLLLYKMFCYSLSFISFSVTLIILADKGICQEKKFRTDIVVQTLCCRRHSLNKHM